MKTEHTEPRIFMQSHAEECTELHRIMTSKKENTGSRGRLALLLKIGESTVRDYLNGRIKHSASFVTACFAATGGDPEVGEMLTPPGWILMPAPGKRAPIQGIEKELGDEHTCAGLLHSDVREALKDGLLDRIEISSLKRRINKGIQELLDVERYLDAAFANGGLPPNTEQTPPDRP
jgi:hypothetical protein